MLSAAETEKLLALVDKLIEDVAPWREKKQAIIDLCDEKDKVNLAEFSAWFEEEEDA